MLYFISPHLPFGYEQTCDNSMKTLLMVNELCDGQQRCTVEATNNFFGNTCSGITKYLDVVYECGA